MIRVKTRSIEEIRSRLDSANLKLTNAISMERDKKTHESIVSEVAAIEGLIEVEGLLKALMPVFEEDLVPMLNFIRDERKSVREEFRSEFELIEKRIMKLLEITQRIEKQNIKKRR